MHYFHNNTLNGDCEWIAIKIYNEIQTVKISTYGLWRSAIEKS